MESAGGKARGLRKNVGRGHAKDGVVRHFAARILPCAAATHVHVIRRCALPGRSRRKIITRAVTLVTEIAIFWVSYEHGCGERGWRRVAATPLSEPRRARSVTSGAEGEPSRRSTLRCRVSRCGTGQGREPEPAHPMRPRTTESSPSSASCTMRRASGQASGQAPCRDPGGPTGHVSAR